MNTKANEEAITISLREVWVLFLKRLWLIALVAVIVGGCFSVWQKSNYEEEYTSEASIIPLYDTSSSGGYMASSLQASLSVINECKTIITSRSVLNNVLADIRADLTVPAELRDRANNMTYAGLKRCVSITNEENSRVLFIYVRTDNADYSKLLADKICSYGSDNIKEILAIKIANVIDEGTLNYAPSNGISTLSAVVVGALAGFAVFALALIVKLTDNKINCAADVEKYLELSVLGEIPLVVPSKRGKAKKKDQY